MTTFPYSSDTSADAESAQLDLIRHMEPALRAEKAIKLSGELLQLAKSAIRRRFPELSEDEVALKFIELNYGQDLANAMRLRKRGSED